MDATEAESTFKLVAVTVREWVMHLNSVDADTSHRTVGRSEAGADDDPNAEQPQSQNKLLAC